MCTRWPLLICMFGLMQMTCCIWSITSAVFLKVVSVAFNGPFPLGKFVVICRGGVVRGWGGVGT